jgi:hypothetical protein
MFRLWSQITSMQSGFCAIHSVATSGNVTHLHMLVEQHADVDARTSTGASLLHLAASKGQTQLVQALISVKADINARDNVSCILRFGESCCWHRISLVLHCCRVGTQHCNWQKEDITESLLHFCVTLKLQSILILKATVIQWLMHCACATTARLRRTRNRILTWGN